MTDPNKSFPNTFLEQRVLRLEKEVSDRTNIIIAANSFLLLPFVSALTSDMITGYLNGIPILICIIGIGLNAFLIADKSKKMDMINEFIQKLKKSPTVDYSIWDGGLVRKIFDTYGPY